MNINNKKGRTAITECARSLRVPFWRRRQFRDDELIRQRANALEWNGRGGRGSKERGGGAPKNGAQKAANNSNNNGHARSLKRCSAVS